MLLIFQWLCENLTLLLFAVHITYLFSDDDIQINIGMYEVTVLISSHCTLNAHQAVLLMKEKEYNSQVTDFKSKLYTGNKENVHLYTTSKN